MLFHIGDRLKHVKSGNYYIIIAEPQIIRIEASNEPAYAYKSIEDTIIWVRPQIDMEDGRFIKCD